MKPYQIHKFRFMTTRTVHNVAQTDLNHSQTLKTSTNTSYTLPKAEPVIGLEVHCQLNTQSKLFSRAGNDSQAPPNTRVDLLDIALPGTLPKLNATAVRKAMVASLGLNCAIQNLVHFDRKNYFYSDMPSGYQLTQYNKPLARDGFIDFIVTTYHDSVIAHSKPYDLVKYTYQDNRYSVEEFQPYVKRSHIKQIQLEQDSAKTLHESSSQSSLVDYNRAGSALIEIVFEPDLRSADEASSLVRELIILLRLLKVCDCELQEGSLRVDANVSIRSIDGQKVDNELGKRVELKNLNSLRSLNRGIKSEIRRQTSELVGGKKVAQESRSYDTKSNKTVVLRTKEDTVDYRYMPEPSIPPLQIDKQMIDRIASHLPKEELPSNKREYLSKKYNIDLLLISELLEEPGLCDYFDEIMQADKQSVSYDPVTVADFLIYVIANLKRSSLVGAQISLDKNENNNSPSDFWRRFSPAKMQSLFNMIFEERISFSGAYEAIKCLSCASDVDTTPEQMVQELDLHLMRDEREIESACDELIKGMKTTRKKYFKTGEEKYLFLMLGKLEDLHGCRMNLRKARDYLERRRLELAQVAKEQRPPPGAD